MFTGIIESLGTVRGVEKDRSNCHFTVESHLAGSLKIDQSLSHNGVCLTVVGLAPGTHTVTAVEETLLCSNLREFSYALYRNNESDRADRCFQDAAVIEAQLLIGLAQNKLDEARQMDVSSKEYKRMLNSACSLAQQAKKVFDRA